MKVSALLLCLKVGTCFRLPRSVFFEHSSLNVVSLTQENGGELNIVLPGFAWTMGELGVGWHPRVNAKVLSKNRLCGGDKNSSQKLV